MDIAVSTVAFRGKSVEEIIQIGKDEQLFLEFSSGLPFREDMISLYHSYEGPKMPHNYFPAPEIPFVLNLASKDKFIRRASIRHCIQGLDLTKKANGPFFAAHAGFCLDPDPNQLGQKITAEMTHSREEHMEIFFHSVREVLEYADHLNLPFLIENNVIIQQNLLEDGTNPLLGCEHEDLLRLIQEINHPLLSILLDTAHLKVSAETLGLDLDQEMEKLRPIIGALHHSDNDGTVDNNQAFNEDYWFLPYIDYFREKVHVIEVKNIDLGMLRRQENILMSGLV
ncbi:MAG: TIM barrel protein [Bacteroidota bacterium]